MSYARKIEDAIAERDELRRWKSTHAPRIEALEGLLKHAQLEAHAGREAIATLASERQANSILTAELDQMVAAERERCAKLCDLHSRLCWNDDRKAQSRVLAAEIRRGEATAPGPAP